tara:strand:+ start:131 stop:355 length:225 start_codon:yes stop_codon:yes gene_type:complete
MSNELEALRFHRNGLLRESDWTVMPDSPLSDDKKAEWKIYRQALRDITKTAKPKSSYLNGILDTSSVTFPEKPS